MAPDIQRLGKPVMIGGTDPQLTHMGNPWLFRFRPNDTYSARVIADYGVKTLDKKKWAIVHSTDAFGTSGMKNLVEVLKGMGVEPALVQGYTNNSQDFTPVVLAVKQSGADVMGTYMTFPPDLGYFCQAVASTGRQYCLGRLSLDSGDERSAGLLDRRSMAPMLSPISPPTQARQQRSSLPNTRRPTSLRPISMGHGPTTRFMFWRSRSTTLRVLSLRRSARRS